MCCNRILFVLFFTAIYQVAFSQKVEFAKQIVDTLSSTFFWGRGYTNDGVLKAEEFLVEKFQSFGLNPLNGESFSQKYSFPVNTFPSKMNLQINGKVLIPGKDFIVSPESKGFIGKGKLTQKDSITFIDFDHRVGIILKDKLTWSVSSRENNYTEIDVLKSATDIPKKYEATIENTFLEKFECGNVCGYVKGTHVPDSFIFFTAHYDHLGGMGDKTYFPGANDNASGVSLLLNLAQYYAKNPAPYSMGFILFSGEEIGLLGSKYFTEHPLISLDKIRFLLNTDLAGTGEEGITVVNATEFPTEFNLLKEINTNDGYLKTIASRGKAANSDHYFFTEKGVPCFFFYTMGGIGAYHDIYDKSETLPLNKHEDLFKLLIQFNNRLMSK